MSLMLLLSTMHTFLVEIIHIILCFHFKGLKARGNVEDWLGKVEESMVNSLKKMTKAAIADYEVKSREEWVTQHASQVKLIFFRGRRLLIGQLNI